MLHFTRSRVLARAGEVVRQRGWRRERRRAFDDAWRAFDDERSRLRAGRAESERLDREQAEKANLDFVRYHAGEIDALEDPDAGLVFVGGPLHWTREPPRWCACIRCQGAHNTWPVLYRPDPFESGEYVLSYVWAPDGSEAWPPDGGEN